MARRFFIIFGILIVLAGMAAGGGYVWFQNQIVRDGPHSSDQVVLVPPGSGINRIAEILIKEQVIRSALLFRLAARLEKFDRALKPGELKFPARANIMDVLGVLRKGEVVARSLTVPEGLTTVEALDIIDRAIGLQGRLPATPPEEGRLLPETYRYAYFDTKAAMVRRLERAMDAALEKSWADRSPNLPLASPGEALILASIVEKETGVAAERPRVAAVFINRLRRGMKLQSDPTVSYGITLGKAPLGRDLTRADLDTVTPYNTYAISGLPPTPIANPGLAAIQAVLHPALTNELYFVADGTGGHAFAENLATHNKNVAKWRKLKKKTTRKAR